MRLYLRNAAPSLQVSVRSRAAVVAAAILLAVSGGCARRTVAPVSHASGAVACPSVSIGVDVDSDLGEIFGIATVTAGGLIADGGGPVAYLWTASAGLFTNPKARTTSFRCPLPDPAGPETIAVTATRGPCAVTQQLVVICGIAEVDGGAGGRPGGQSGVGGAGGDPDGPDDAGVDAATDGNQSEGSGDAGDAGGSDMRVLTCGAGDPTVDEGDACNQCTLDNCTIQENVRFKVAPTAGCHQYASDAQRQRCMALYCCMRSNHCVIDGYPTACLCGDTDPTNCALGIDPARGPCLAELQAAAGTTDVPQISSSMIDPALPVGGAVNLATCRATFCATECFGFQ